MTAQIHEILIYGGKVGMATEPLKQHLKTRKDIRFSSITSYCWRGYQGKWEVNNNKLYLVGLQGHIRDRKGYHEVSLDYLFPGKSEVFAEWYSGEIRIPLGEILEYVHGGFSSIYEKDLFLKFDKGILTGTRETDNRGTEKEKRAREKRELPIPPGIKRDQNRI